MLEHSSISDELRQDLLRDRNVSIVSGTYFNYAPGRIEARFSHDTEFDYINLDIRMGGDITTTTECDDQGRLAKPESHQKEDAEFQVYISSVWCPFTDLIRFLEAITIEVQECSFSWDPEGPEGRMRWERRCFQGTGFLTVEWKSSDKQFSHRMMLNTRQAVSMLYTALRSFAESPEYDPLRYEQLTAGESFALVLSNSSLDDLAGALIQLNATAAESVIQCLKEVIGSRHTKGPKLSFTIGNLLESTETVISSSEFNKPWIHPDWDSWNLDQRLTDLKSMFEGDSSSWYGANLRELRSKLIEDWLALPEPQPRQNFIVPRQTDESEPQ